MRYRRSPSMRSPLSRYQIPAAPFEAVGFFGSGRPAAGQADRPAYFGLADYVRQPILSANVMISMTLRTTRSQLLEDGAFPELGTPVQAPCLAAFEGPRDLVSGWGREWLCGPICHDDDALTRRTYLANHRGRNAC
jgi:hypothetical protein